MSPWAVARVAHIKRRHSPSQEIFDGVRLSDSLLGICTFTHVTVTLPGTINHQLYVNTAIFGDL